MRLFLGKRHLDNYGNCYGYYSYAPLCASSTAMHISLEGKNGKVNRLET